ncbi:tyrosine--tRNA ligase [Amylibacter sp.]|jgi:tyrosyl-tRNA synthetase|nr:tyrosine--tRNA ligase [Amylibacter sp.]MDA9300248.1 tyrosine--tRNA ligase [Amylibacter sp.]MDA9302224.1 tyrosine--tRNA ligase [Amylibacter sp.]MDB4184601.1 tyrosine--tRNA ligase [Amylibacter sp.]MDB9786222.1 tyrosine--tRNA ligase [Amylibacter sp.]|tara:strand:- start:5246 stop:6499 length:1254 start_codon:yes stop_codon:yes gene_type:complete
MTYNPKSEFLQEMLTRGFLQDCTDLQGLDEKLLEGCMPAYIGFDATADSLHIGSLIQIMMLRWLQKTGHKPMPLMGGGTTKIGDPSGKDESRQLITTDTINTNISGIQKVFEKYLTFGVNRTDAKIINNSEWLDKLNYIEFLRDIGKHFTINRMISMESVKLRLDREQPLTFLEFNYMLLQAYDFMELNNRYEVALQMGGSDQWGNIVNGIDLTRRLNKNSVFGLTTPLLTKADGSKMGKSANGAIWLNSDKLSPYEFWQYWRNTLDADVGKFLKLFTELPVIECERLGALEGQNINEAKIILANEVTKLCHGSQAAINSANTAHKVFSEDGSDENLPTLEIHNSEISDGLSFTQALLRTGLVSSGKEAKRIIAGGGARLNDQIITDAGYMLERSELNNILKITASKKKHALIKIIQ